MKEIRNFMRNPSARIGSILLGIILVITIVGPFLVQDPFNQNLSHAQEGISLQHPLGMDEIGRDELARIVHGARYTLSSGIIAVLLGLVGGLILGSIAGYYGRIADKIIMGICDVLLSFPSILLAMAIVMIMRPGIFTPMIAVGISSIPVFARQVRAQFLSIKQTNFVEAAKAAGAGDFRIIFIHLIPNSIGPVIIQATLRIGGCILTAATLSFLGMGAQPPTPEWGAMLNTARPYIWSAPHLAIIPGCAITLAVIAVNLIGDALRDYLDPRTRNQ
ncbi:MAG: ABC transporter permease [Clostridia bacterium]|nr:ABC transporter permease [Clostridia bacterium]